MKYSLSLFLSVSFIAPTLAQTNKADDSLLLGYYQDQHFAEAADYLKKLYPEPVTNPKVLSGMAYASMMAGRLPDAQGYYERIYAIDTTNTPVLFNLGAVNARRGNNVKAIGYYKKILLRDSTNFNVLKQLATLLQNTGDYNASVGYLQKANKINPLEADVAYDLCAFYLNSKQYVKADTVVSTALQADTANLVLTFSKAQAEYRLQHYQNTVDLCERVMQNGDSSTMVVNMLGPSYYELKNYPACIATLKVLERNNAASETSYYYTAMSFKNMNDQQSAVIYFDKAIKEAVSGNVNSYYGEMADSYDKLHRVKKAVDAYQKSLLYGTIPLTYYALGNLYDSELRNKNMALRYYRKYIASGPPDGQDSYIAYAKRRIKELAEL